MYTITQTGTLTFRTRGGTMPSASLTPTTGRTGGMLTIGSPLCAIQNLSPARVTSCGSFLFLFAQRVDCASLRAYALFLVVVA